MLNAWKQNELVGEVRTAGIGKRLQKSSSWWSDSDEPISY